jgi:hypothetical protein
VAYALRAVRGYGVWLRTEGLTDATISTSNSPSPGFLTLTSSIFHPPLARVSWQTIAFALYDML